MGEPKPPRVRRPNIRKREVRNAIAAAQSCGCEIARIEIDAIAAKITMTMKDCTVTETNINPFRTAPYPTPPVRNRRKSNHESDS
jgi:hypothetical protein